MKPLVDLFSFVFWRKLKTTKINWQQLILFLFLCLFFPVCSCTNYFSVRPFLDNIWVALILLLNRNMKFRLCSSRRQRFSWWFVKHGIRSTKLRWHGFWIYLLKKDCQPHSEKKTFQYFVAVKCCFLFCMDYFFFFPKKKHSSLLQSRKK